MKKALFLVGMVILASDVRAVEFLWGVTGTQGAPSDLYAINPANAALLGKVGSTGTNNVSGLALHPTTGVLYATHGSQSDEQLLRIDKSTGAATAVGTMGVAVTDTAFRPDGTLYAFGAITRALYTVNLVTAAPVQIAANLVAGGPVALTFSLTGNFHYVRTNGLFQANPANGATITGPTALSGATTTVDNLFATNSAGVMYVASRVAKGGPTQLFTINPSTGVTAAVGTIPLGLSGMEFGTATGPTAQVTGKKRIKTKKSRVTLKGTASSFLPLTVTAKGAKPATVEAGSWTLNLRVKKGRNRVKVNCADGFGQSTGFAVSVIRSF